MCHGFLILTPMLLEKSGTWICNEQCPGKAQLVRDNQQVESLYVVSLAVTPAAFWAKINYGIHVVWQ